MLIRPEDELFSWGKAQNLYLRSGEGRGNSKKEFESEVVFKNISSIKGKQSVSRLMNYITRNHHEGDEIKHEQLCSADGVQEVIVCNELGQRLTRHQIESVKKSWNNEVIQRKDTGRTFTHFVFSSDKIKDPKVMSEVVQATLSKTLGSEGFRYVTSVHNDTDTLHCHVVVNTYNEILERKLNVTKEWTHQQRDTFSKMARRRGYKHVATMKKWRNNRSMLSDDMEPVISKLVEHGSAPYENNKKNSESYYIKLSNGATIWGVGLKQALAGSGAGVGDFVEVDNLGTEKVKVPTRNGGYIDAERVNWKIEKYEKQDISIKDIEPTVKQKPLIVRNANSLVKKSVLKQNASDLVRLERTVKNPTSSQKMILQKLRKTVSKKAYQEASSDYPKKVDKIYQSKLKQIKYLESQNQKGVWKESFTMKVLGLERSTSDNELKARLDALIPEKANKDLLRSQFEKQNKVNALIQSIPLQRKLNPEKVPFLIERIKKDIDIVAMNEKSRIQLQKGLYNKTIPEFNKRIESYVRDLNKALEQRDLIQAKIQVSALASELNGKPRVKDISDLIARAKSQMDGQRTELKNELGTLRNQYKTESEYIRSGLSATEKVKASRKLESIGKRVNLIEKSLGFAVTNKRTEKQVQKR